MSRKTKTSFAIRMAMLVGVALFLSAGCAEKPKLMLYNWDAYIDPDLVKAFEKEFKCKVVQDTFDSNEMLEAKMKSGAANYDIIVPSSYVTERLYKQGLIQKLDHSLIPNLQHVDQDILAQLPDGDMEHSVPYMMGYAAIGYNADQVKGFEATWRMFERGDLKNRVTLLNDLREVIGAALLTLGYSVNTRSEAEIKEAAQLVMKWKQTIAKFENEQYKNGLASGEYFMVQGYVCDMLQVQEENPKKNIEIAIPQEGTTFAVDMLVIPAGAKNLELAYAFINFLHDPEIAAQNTEWVCQVCPNSASYPLLDKEFLENDVLFPDPELKAKCELLEDVGDAIAIYNRYWDLIKTRDSID